MTYTCCVVIGKSNEENELRAHMCVCVCAKYIDARQKHLLNCFLYLLKHKTGTYDKNIERKTKERKKLRHICSFSHASWLGSVCVCVHSTAHSISLVFSDDDSFSFLRCFCYSLLQTFVSTIYHIIVMIFR